MWVNSVLCRHLSRSIAQLAEVGEARRGASYNYGWLPVALALGLIDWACGVGDLCACVRAVTDARRVLCVVAAPRCCSYCNSYQLVFAQVRAAAHSAQSAGGLECIILF